MKKVLFWLGGALSGFLNGLLGAGGGMIIVPMLRKKVDTKKAHATSIAIILPITIVSALFYYNKGIVSFSDANPYILWGLLGSIIGILILSKIKSNILRKIFAILMIWCGWRLLIR